MNPIVCVSGVDLLTDYLEGATSPEVREALDAHVAGCEKCAAFIRAYAVTPGIFRDATSVELPDELASMLIATLRVRGLVP